MNRFRPRFTVRTLAIVVTLVCAYFGAWEATKKLAEQCVSTRGEIIIRECWVKMALNELGTSAFVQDAESPLPLVISQDEWGNGWTQDRRYYLWLFGPNIKLPFQST